jgi:hypothetical protein
MVGRFYEDNSLESAIRKREQEQKAAQQRHK